MHVLTTPLAVLLWMALIWPPGRDHGVQAQILKFDPRAGGPVIIPGPRPILGAARVAQPVAQPVVNPIVLPSPSPRSPVPSISSSSKQLSDLAGTWENELGSLMYLNVSIEGHLSGQYQSAVGPALGFYSLVGRVRMAADPTKDAPNAILAWIVDWKNENGDLQSITTWNGEWLSTDVLSTVWTLVIHSDADGNSWGDTRTRSDQFVRVG